MNKEKFLAELEERLESIPASCRYETVSYYEEILNDYVAAGYSEESALTRIPRLDDIVEQVLADPTLAERKRNFHSRRESMHTKPQRKPWRVLRWWEILLLVLTAPFWILLLLAAAVLTLALFLLCVLTVVAIYALDLALAVVSLAALLCAPIPAILQTSISWLLLLLGIAFLCGGVSILLLRGANRLSIRFWRLCKYVYFRSVAKIRERRRTA